MHMHLCAWTRRAGREYEIRSRVVRTETEQSYSKTRMSPRALALSGVAHVLSPADVERLRGGVALVIDAQPALLTTELMAAAHSDLMRLVEAGGESTDTYLNPNP